MRGRRPNVMFLPVSGDRGVGECARSMVLAEAFARRHPGARLRFVLSERSPVVASGAAETLGEVHRIPGSPTFHTREVVRILGEDPPDVAVFDNAGRTAQLARARALGVRTVYVSSRPTTRRKGFCLRRLRFCDQLWLVGFRSRAKTLSAWERLKLRVFPGTEVLHLDAIGPESVAARREALKTRLGIGEDPYVFFAPGGGGWSVGGRPAAEMFLESARGVATETGLRCIVTPGPLHAGSLREAPGVTVFPATPSETADLTHDARLLVIGGGSMVGQALACGQVAVAVPLGGTDQRARVDALAEQGVLASSEADSDAVRRASVSLLQDPDRTDRIRLRIEAMGLRNGLELAVESLGRLLYPR